MVRDSSSLATTRPKRMRGLLSLALQLQPEVGIALLTVSLLYLPWFSNRYATVMGIEFITNPQGDIFSGYMADIKNGFPLFWEAYFLCRILPTRWSRLSLLPFSIASWFYLRTPYFWFPGPRSFRGGPSMIDVGFGPESGIWLNLIGALILLVGLCETRITHSPVWWSIRGFIGGLILHYILFNTPFGAVSYYAGIFCVGLPFAGAVFAAWLAIEHRHRGSE